MSTQFKIQDESLYKVITDEEEIIIPDSVHKIEKNVFAKNNKLISVIIPDTVTEIGDEAFAECKNLRKVKLPNGIREIRTGTFENCKSLEEIDIPESVIKLDEGCFAGCENLKKITGIKEETDLSGNPFYSKNNTKPGLTDENGFLILNRTLFGYYGDSEEVTVPEGVEIIGSYALSSRELESVTLSSTVKEIASYAFYESSNLKSVKIFEGVETIGEYAFYGCAGLDGITLPESIKEIKESAFEKCECLRAINIPSTVKEIDKNTFSNCQRLKEVTIANGPKAILDSAFCYCYGLKEINIPESVEIIEYKAFGYCNKLAKVNVANMDCVIDTYAFSWCPSIERKDGLEIIGSYLCRVYSTEENIIVPEGIKTIMDDAFAVGYTRSSIADKLKSVTLPSSLETIGNEAFGGCEKLENIIFKEGIKLIGKSAFSCCLKIKEINLPDSVEQIGEKAFNSCQSIKEFTVPKNTKRINSKAFNNCSSLKKVYIHKDVEYIDCNAFAQSTTINEFVVDENNKYFSSKDGILFNKEGNVLLCYPPGKKGKNFVIPEEVDTIERYAFFTVNKLDSITIPSTVKKIMDNAFFNESHYGKIKTQIIMDINAGSEFTGKEIFNFQHISNETMIYPKLPVKKIKEPKSQIALAFGYCTEPDKYEGEYAAQYREFVLSHMASIAKKATSLKLSKVTSFIKKLENSGDVKTKKKTAPKKLSDQAKVELLETTVLNGTLEELEEVLKTQKTFEFTARALALAARYRGLDFVKKLYEYGATFNYENALNIRRKYGTTQTTESGEYKMLYYLLLIPDKINISKYSEYEYLYTPLATIAKINISDNTLKPLDEETRIDIAKYLCTEKKPEVSKNELLFFALLRGKTGFADMLMEMGADLKEIPSYYGPWHTEETFFDAISQGRNSYLWSEYIRRLTSLNKNDVLPVLERLNVILQSEDKNLIITQKIFTEMNWNDESLSYAITNINLEKINQKMLLEKIVDIQSIKAMESAASRGMLKNSIRRESIIEYATASKKTEILAWLIDYKNRTVDVVAEEAKKEAKMMKELMEDPNSVSALKKIWSYEKLGDDTLRIKSYKGSDVNVVIPSMIGKNRVRVIGENAFEPSNPRCRNEKARENIKSIVVPEGVEVLEREAFRSMYSLKEVQLPQSLKTIEKYCFYNCGRLKKINIHKGTTIEDKSVFWGCDGLRDDEGRLIILNTIYSYTGKNKKLVIPEGVEIIGEEAFEQDRYAYSIDGKISEIEIPDSVKEIRDRAFRNVKLLKEVNIPASVKKIGNKAFADTNIEKLYLHEGLESIGNEAFYGTWLREVVIPESVKSIGGAAFERNDELANIYIPGNIENLGKDILGMRMMILKQVDVKVHTPSGSKTEEYMKQFPDVYLDNEYPKK